MSSDILKIFNKLSTDGVTWVSQQYSVVAGQMISALTSKLVADLVTFCWRLSGEHCLQLYSAVLFSRSRKALSLTSVDIAETDIIDILRTVLHGVALDQTSFAVVISISCH